MIRGIEGSKVKFIGNQDSADTVLLKKEKEYTVDSFTMGLFRINDEEQWHPCVYLKEINGVAFIATIFEDVKIPA